MTLLYIITFGTFSGLAAQFGLLIKNLYGADVFGADGRRARRSTRSTGRWSARPHASSPARSPTVSAGRG